MKNLSLKLEDDIIEEAERISSRLNIARNKYINEAINIYNLVNKRRLLKKQLAIESKLVRKNSLEVLKEFSIV